MMYTSTVKLGLNNLGQISGGQLNASQQYNLTRCIEVAKMIGYSLAEFMQEFIENRHPELRDYILRDWNLV